LVPPNKVGTAFGVAFSTLNIGLAIIPEIEGIIHDQTPGDLNGWFWVSMLLLGISLVGLVAILAVGIKFKIKARYLNRRYTTAKALFRGRIHRKISDPYMIVL